MPFITINQLAIPAVVTLISFLAYGSQAFFYFTEPASFSLRQSVIFNACVMCIWICYLRACFTDPGHVSSEWAPGGDHTGRTQGRCRKCPSKAPKAPRSHHCKICQRYVDMRSS